MELYSGVTLEISLWPGSRTLIFKLALGAYNTVYQGSADVYIYGYDQYTDESVHVTKSFRGSLEEMVLITIQPMHCMKFKVLLYM